MEGLGRGLGFCLVVVMAAVAAPGCGGSSDGGDAPATAEAFCDSITNVFAATEARCYGGSEADWAMQMGATSCASLGPLTTTVQYDRSKASACLATIKTRFATACTAEFDC